MVGLEGLNFVLWKVKLNIIFNFAAFSILNLFETFTPQNLPIPVCLAEDAKLMLIFYFL